LERSGREAKLAGFREDAFGRNAVGRSLQTPDCSHPVLARKRVAVSCVAWLAALDDFRNWLIREAA
jgi:hypothetical protein